MPDPRESRSGESPREPLNAGAAQWNRYKEVEEGYFTPEQLQRLADLDERDRAWRKRQAEDER